MVEEKCDIYGCSDKIVAGSDDTKPKKNLYTGIWKKKWFFRPLDKNDGLRRNFCLEIEQIICALTPSPLILTIYEVHTKRCNNMFCFRSYQSHSKANNSKYFRQRNWINGGYSNTTWTAHKTWNMFLKFYVLFFDFLSSNARMFHIRVSFTTFTITLTFYFRQFLGNNIYF